MLILAVVMGALAFIFYALAVFRFLRSGGEDAASASGAPVMTDDTSADDKGIMTKQVGQALLAGKPDGLVPIDGKPVPVKRLPAVAGDPVKAQEVKSAAKLEITALSLLLKEKSGSNPLKGILKLPGQEDQVVAFTDNDVKQVESLIEQVAYSLTTKKNIRRNHAQAERCLKCEFNAVCEQQLVERS